MHHATLLQDGAALLIYDAKKHKANGFSPQESLRSILYLVDLGIIISQSCQQRALSALQLTTPKPLTISHG